MEVDANQSITGLPAARLTPTLCLERQPSQLLFSDPEKELLMSVTSAPTSLVCTSVPLALSHCPGLFCARNKYLKRLLGQKCPKHSIARGNEVGRAQGDRKQFKDYRV